MAITALWEKFWLPGLSPSCVHPTPAPQQPARVTLSKRAKMVCDFWLSYCDRNSHRATLSQRDIYYNVQGCPRETKKEM